MEFEKLGATSLTGTIYKSLPGKNCLVSGNPAAVFPQNETLPGRWTTGSSIFAMMFRAFEPALTLYPR